MAKRIYRAELVLTEQERAELNALMRKHKTAQALAVRARIVLRCAEGESHLAVAVALGVSNMNVGKRRRRCVEDRMDGLRDKLRPGQPRKISDENIEQVIVMTLNGNRRTQLIGACDRWRPSRVCIATASLVSGKRSAPSRIGERCSRFRKTHCLSIRSAMSSGST